MITILISYLLLLERLIISYEINIFTKKKYNHIIVNKKKENESKMQVHMRTSLFTKLDEIKSYFYVIPFFNYLFVKIGP